MCHILYDKPHWLYIFTNNEQESGWNNRSDQLFFNCNSVVVRKILFVLSIFRQPNSRRLADQYSLRFMDWKLYCTRLVTDITVAAAKTRYSAANSAHVNRQASVNIQ